MFIRCDSTFVQKFNWILNENYIYGIATLFSVLPLENEQQLLELSNDNNTIQVLKANIQTNNFD